MHLLPCRGTIPKIPIPIATMFLNTKSGAGIALGIFQFPTPHRATPRKNIQAIPEIPESGTGAEKNSQNLSKGKKTTSK